MYEVLQQRLHRLEQELARTRRRAALWKLLAKRLWRVR
jgi:hypothetical protein